MDIERLRKLAGQSKTLTEEWKELKLNTSTDASQSKSRKKTKDNNKDTSNKSATDVRTIDKNADIANDVTAELMDVDDTSISMTDGKMDAGGETAPYKTAGSKPTDGERLNYTISINDAGAPVVDDNTVIEPVATHSIGDYGYGESVEHVDGAFLIESDEDAVNVYMELKECGTLLEDISAELKKKIEQQGPVQISVLYKGDNFTGHIHEVGNNELTITPSNPTRTRYGIKKKDIRLPLNINKLGWSKQHDSRVVGRVEQVTHDINDAGVATGDEVRRMGVQVSSYKNIGTPLTELARNKR